MDCVYEVVQTNRAPCGTVRWDPLRFGERNYLGPQRENFAFNDFWAPRTISAFDDFCLAERAVAAVVPRWVPDRGRLADRALLLHDATRTPPERTQAGAAATRSS